jgi:hypothetical protein
MQLGTPYCGQICLADDLPSSFGGIKLGGKFIIMGLPEVAGGLGTKGARVRFLAEDAIRATDG